MLYTESITSRNPAGETAARKLAAPEGPVSKSLADALSAKRGRIAARLLGSLEGWEKYAAEIAAGRDEFLCRELHVFVDYLSLLFRTGDRTFQYLYIGEKSKQFYDPANSPQQARERRAQIVASDRDAIVGALLPGLSETDEALLAAKLDEIGVTLLTEARHEARVIFIGDCLYLDLVGFLTGPLLAQGISLQPVFLTQKNPGELGKAIRELSTGKHHAVFYSPFTYEFSLEYATLQQPRRALANRASVGAAVESAKAEIVRTLDLLADLFECNIFVHNSANIRRHNGSWSDRLKGFLTSRVRTRARNAINPWIASYCREKNEASFPHVWLIDETAVLRHHSEDELGRYFYHSQLQHPAVMGRALAPEYERNIAVQVRLLSVKLIVCDLDNTLWDGVIGEGAVAHFHERQNVLKKLRSKGVVLAICSKNDPRNVHWNGGTLSEEDFVAAAINWESKPSNVRRIAKELNLKTKDFLFLDDRADERELVEMANPEIRTMDPAVPETWALLERWADLLPEQTETDRTEFYKQREKRQQFLDSSDGDAEHHELLRKLELRVKIRQCRAADIPRAVELINRTNQFNLCGSRTSVRELSSWLQSEDWMVLAADASDKFGDMGTVSIIVSHLLPERLEIPVFVLSCRVFGYGIETAIINTIQASINRDASVSIHGLYVETPSNEPCRKVYPENGFEWAHDRWLFTPEDSRGCPADPAWLHVSREPLRWSDRATVALR